MDKFNLREYLSNNPLLKENVGGAVEIEFQNWLDEMSTKFEDEKITLQTVIEYAQEALRQYAMDDWQPGQPLPETNTLNEEVMVDVGLMMGADEDEIPVKGKIPAKEFLSLFGKYWETTGEYGGDSDFIYQGLEAHVEDGVLSPEEAGQVMLMYWDDPDMDPDEIEDILNTFK